MELKFLNYDTNYSVAINGTNRRNFTHSACFGTLFNFINITKNDTCVYNIWINRSEEYVKAHNRDNYCFLTHKELYNHISLVKKLFNFKLSIKDYDDHYDVKVTIKAPKICHKYLLTWIRYTYESPMNVMFVDINLLKQLPIFKFESKANLYLLLCYATNWHHHRNVHSIVKASTDYNSIPGKVLTNAQLIKKLSNVYRLNDIYSGNYDFSYKVNAVYDTDINKIINSFPNRCNIYIDNYLKYIKK